jgi:hypothetical protein
MVRHSFVPVTVRAAVLACCILAQASAQPIRVQVQLDKKLGPMEIERYGLGQGGYNVELGLSSRISELRVLRPKLIRLFVMEYYDLLPAPKKYNWAKLDEAVDVITKTGAKPLMCIVFKPKVLFPRIDADLVEPTSWEEWEELVYRTVRHYKDRGSGIRYWEVGNEVELVNGGGAPYHFTPASYTRYYQHTVKAVLRADPDASVGGPALAHSNDPILAAWLSFCEKTKTPIHFVSWHVYARDPLRFRDTTQSVKSVVQQYPSLRPELIIDEWTLSPASKNTNPQFKPCAIAEATYQMKENGVSYSCFYQIRDVHVDVEDYGRFTPPDVVAEAARGWNLGPVSFGLFDFQNTVRPSYFMFKLLSRLTGERVALNTGSPTVHGYASHDAALQSYSVLLWNYSNAPAQLEVAIEGAPENLTVRPFVLDAAGPSNDDNDRIRPLDRIDLKGEPIKYELEPYGVTYWMFERRRR